MTMVCARLQPKYLLVLVAMVSAVVICRVMLTQQQHQQQQAATERAGDTEQHPRTINSAQHAIVRPAAERVASNKQQSAPDDQHKAHVNKQQSLTNNKQPSPTKAPTAAAPAADAPHWRHQHWCNINCTTGVPCRYRDEVDLRILLLVATRPDSLQKSFQVP